MSRCSRGDKPGASPTESLGRCPVVRRSIESRVVSTTKVRCY